MVKNQNIYERLYNLFYTQIQMGLYKYGDKLPSMNWIGEQFGISIVTIQNAMSLLQEQGYITFSRGKNPIVICKKTTLNSKEDIVQHILERKNHLEIVYEALNLLLPEMLAQGILGMSEQQLYDISQSISLRYRSFLDNVMTPQIIPLFTTILGQFKNPMLTTMFIENVVDSCYPELPFMWNIGLNKKDFYYLINVYLQEIIRLCRKKEYAEIKCLFRKICIAINEKNLSIVQYLSERYESVPQIDYQWNAFKGRRLSCIPTAQCIIQKILDRHYQPGDFIPSVNALAKEYDISIMSARRTVEILADMGFAETINGKGSRIVNPTLAGKTSITPTPNIQKGVQLFMQSLQILILSIEDTGAAAFLHARECDKAELRKALYYKIFPYGFFPNSHSCLDFVFRNIPNSAVRNIFQQLNGQLLWGYCLTPFFKQKDAQKDFSMDSSSIIKAIDKNDATLFARELARQLLHILQYYKKKLEELGFQNLVLPSPVIYG